MVCNAFRGVAGRQRSEYGDRDVLPREVIIPRLSVPNAERIFFLRHALRAGFSHVEWIKNDSDFDAIRDHPRFHAALRALEERSASAARP